MRESEFTDLMKAALKDDAYWVAITSGQDRDDAIEWLREALTRVRSDKRIRESRWKAESVQHRRFSPEWRSAFAAFNNWKASAYAFEQRVVYRLRDLGLNEQGHPIAQPKADSLVVAHQHAEYMQSRLRLTTNSLLDLASAIQLFDAGDITRIELVAALDGLTMPDGTGESTIRTVLDSRANSQSGAVTIGAQS